MNLPKGWKEIKLSDIASHRTIKNKDSKYTETYTNSAMQGIVRQTEYFDKEISNKENIADTTLLKKMTMFIIHVFQRQHLAVLLANLILKKQG